MWTTPMLFGAPTDTILDEFVAAFVEDFPLLEASMLPRLSEEERTQLRAGFLPQKVQEYADTILGLCRERNLS